MGYRYKSINTQQEEQKAFLRRFLLITHNLMDQLFLILIFIVPLLFFFLFLWFCTEDKEPRELFWKGKYKSFETFLVLNWSPKKIPAIRNFENAKQLSPLYKRYRVVGGKKMQASLALISCHYQDKIKPQIFQNQTKT